MGTTCEPLFTGKERDSETGLDYFGARYFSAAQGRFTSPDEFTGGIVDPFTGQQVGQPGPLPYADITDPQTLNKYAYVRNNPLRYIDPDGHEGVDTLLDTAIQEIDEVVRPLIESAGKTATQGGSYITGGIVRGVGLVAGLLLSPMPAGGQDEVRFEREMQRRNADYQQQQQQQRNPGQVGPPAPTPQNAEHTKNPSPSKHDKHTKVRPGQSPPPNYAPNREYKQPKEKRTNQPAPPKKHKNKYKKDDENGTA
jgi:RHS repeat-associated protein